MSQTEHFTRSRAAQEDRTERAWAAVKAFRSMQHGLSSYARAITGNPAMSVKLGSGPPHTDGKDIYYQPPIALGDKTPHDRLLCDKRDENKVLLCQACAINEEVLVNIYHEIGHLVGGTFAEPTASDKITSLEKAIDEWGGKYASQIKKKFDSAPAYVLESYKAMSSLVSPFLPFLFNSIEDARVDSGMFRARPGIRTMMEASTLLIFSEGADLGNGETRYWRDEPLNKQASIACYLAACGYQNWQSWLHEEITKAFEDERLKTLLEDVAMMESAVQAYETSFKALAILREHGFFQMPEDQEEENQPSEEESEGEDGHEDSEQSSDGPGTEEGTPEPRGEDGGDSDKQPEPQDGEGDGEGEDGQASEGGEAGDDSEAGASVSGESGEGEEQESSGEDDTQGSDDDPSEAGDEAVGSTPGDVLGDADDLSEVADPGELGEDSGGSEAVGRDEQSQEDGEEPSGSSEAGDESELIDTGADDGTGGVETSVPSYGSPEDLEGALQQFHKDEVAITETPQESEAVSVAIVQGMYFETPSTEVVGVREHKYDEPTYLANGERHDPAWHHDRLIGAFGRKNRSALGIDEEVEVPESVLGPALLQTRRVFTDNQTAAHQRNLKSGRIDARTLGKRAWNGDPRLFTKKRLSGKRSYAVLIGIDISGSTIGVNIALAKRAAWAQAELCGRAGIDFAVYAHSAGTPDGTWGVSSLALDIYEIKSFDEPWDERRKVRLRELGPDSENLDGHTLEYYRKRLDEREATDKILLYYTDGKMPAANYEEELEILQREIATCKRKGYTLLGVGIRTDSPTKHGLDTVQVNDDEDLKSVVMHLEKRLVRK